jgi:hypothetical protein
VTGVGEGHLHTSRGIAEGCGALVKISAKTKGVLIALYDNLSPYTRDNSSDLSFRGTCENTYRGSEGSQGSASVDVDTHWYEFEFSAKSIGPG